MNFLEIVKEAQAAWNYLNGRSEDTLPQCPGEIKSVIELTRAAASIATTEQYRDSVKAVSEAYAKSVEPPPDLPAYAPFMAGAKPTEELEKKMRESRKKASRERIADLWEIAVSCEGQVCPLTLIGEYPRPCIQEKCMWNGKSANECVGHVFIRGGDIATEMKPGSAT